jgi:hypothetical protein
MKLRLIDFEYYKYNNYKKGKKITYQREVSKRTKLYILSPVQNIILN